MRVAPIGLLAQDKRYGMEEIARLGAAAAAITHSHELGYIPAAVFSLIIAYLIRGNDLLEAVLKARGKTFSLFENTEQVKYFNDLIDKAVDLALSEDTFDDLDAIRELGEGWIAEETLAIAIYCALRHKNSFENALIASVNHSGDSDSTGAVTGNIMGTYLGYKKIPDKFKKELDVEKILNCLSDQLVL